MRIYLLSPYSHLQSWNPGKRSGTSQTHDDSRSHLSETEVKQRPKPSHILPDAEPEISVRLWHLRLVGVSPKAEEEIAEALRKSAGRKLDRQKVPAGFYSPGGSPSTWKAETGGSTEQVPG